MVNNAFHKYNNYVDYSKANLSEIVVSYVKDKILAGDLKSGDRLVETDISEELQISRAPVREAIRELNMQGILSFSPRRGSQIFDMTYEDIAEVFSIRIPLEMQILTIIFEKSLLSEEDLCHLERVNDDMLKAESGLMDIREKVYRLNTSDFKFHSFFWYKSGSFRRAHILENEFFQLLTAMNRDISTLGSIEEKYMEHKKIIEACRMGSLEETLSAFKGHMESYLNAITNL